MSDKRKCEICGSPLEAHESSDVLCELCLICESERVSMGGTATPRYYRDASVN